MTVAASSYRTATSLTSIVTIAMILSMLYALNLRPIPVWTNADASNHLRLAFAPLSDSTEGYVARGHGFSLQLTRDAASLTLPTETGTSRLQMSFVNARPEAQLSGTDPLAGVMHYYLGNDPRAWRRDVALHERVRYADLYAGIDAVFYGNGERFEYDFIVAPGADPAVIALQFSGARSIRVDDAGDLLLETEHGSVRQLRPQLYQMEGTRRVSVDGEYVINTQKNEVRFAVGPYDVSRALVIDPVLDYGTFLGGSLGDAATRVAVDADGNMTLVGYTFSTDLVITLNHGTEFFGGADTRHAFVSKYKADGTLIYVAYLGGTLDDLATDVAVDAAGNAYVVGETHSPNFPVNQGPTHGGDVDAFLTVLSSNGTQLNYSRFIGGSDYDVGHGVALGPNNLVYIAGETWSSEDPPLGKLPIPVTSNAFDKTCSNCGADTNDGFLAVVDTINNTLPYVTYYGGIGNDKLHAVAVNRKSGVAYLTGETDSTDLPMRNGFRTTPLGAFDAMVVAIDPSKSGDASLVYASYFGGSNEDYAEHIAITASGQLYVVGGTQSTDLLLKGAYQKTLRGSSDGFVLKIDPTSTGSASLLYATYFGGSGEDEAAAVTVDRDEGALFVGMTNSTDLPTKSPIQNALRGATDAYVAKLNASGSALSFGSYLGGDSDDAATGVAVDGAGNVIIAGDSSSPDFPLAGSSAQSTKQALADATLIRLTPLPAGSTSSGGSSGSQGGNASAKASGGAFDVLMLLAIAAAWRRRRVSR